MRDFVRVVVATKDPNTRAATKDLQASKEADFYHCGRGIEALRLVRELEPDVALLSTSLQVMGAFECCHALRKDLGCKSTRIGILSNSDDEVLKGLSSVVGARGFFREPENGEQLREVLALCRQPARSDDERSTPVAAFIGNGSGRVVDPDTGLATLPYLQRRMTEECRRANRYLHDLSFVRLTIENLDELHAAYDDECFRHVILEIAGILLQECRDVDIAAFRRPHHFELLLPDTNHDGAMMVGRRLKHLLEDHTYRWTGPRPTFELRGATMDGREHKQVDDLNEVTSVWCP